MSISNGDIALAIISFLKKSVSNNEISPDFIESMDVAIDCVADAYGVNKDDDALTIATRFEGKCLPELVEAGLKSGLKTGDDEKLEDSEASSIPVHIPVEDVELRSKAEALKLEGNRAMSRKDYDEAIKKYTEAIELIPTNSVYLSNRAAAYSSIQKHDLAIKDAEKAIESDGTYAKAYSRLGLAKFALGDIKGSMDAYKAGLEAEGENPSASMKKGYETAKARVQQELESSIQSSGNDGTNSGSGSSGSRGTQGTQGAGSGFPDLGSMFGGGAGGAGGAGGLAEMFNNPQLMQAAQQMMQNPEALQGLMNNPSIRQMAQSMGLGGAGTNAGSGAGSGTSANASATDETTSSSDNTQQQQQQPDISELLNNPMLQNLANQFLGGANRRS